jgi:large subunit ribosomal protein L13
VPAWFPFPYFKPRSPLQPTPAKKQLTLRATLVISVPFHTLMKTFSAKANEVPRKWWIIDANNQVLGQVAVKAANLLRGKEKVIYTTHVDTGDFVIVINAEKVRLTGKKEEQKTFMSFSGFVGGHKTENARARRARHPELLVERAIRGMIPHNKLGRAVYRKLKVYAGDLHPHAAQQPANVSLAS